MATGYKQQGSGRRGVSAWEKRRAPSSRGHGQWCLVGAAAGAVHCVVQREEQQRPLLRRQLAAHGGAGVDSSHDKPARCTEDRAQGSQVHFGHETDMKV
jgi:hypothetical protein